jgi:type II secretory pathway component PulF
MDEVDPASRDASGQKRPDASDVRIPSRVLNVMTRQFASLVRSGVPLLRSLMILGEQSQHAGLKQIMGLMAEDVRRGETLSGAMRRFPGVFTPIYTSLIRAGEAGGMLDVVLDRLALKADRDDALRGKLQGALAYPLFVGATGIVTVVFLMTFVLPRILKLFEGFGERLPAPTRLLMQTSQLMSRPGFWVGVLICAVFLAIFWRMPQSSLRRGFQRLLLQLPVSGPLVRQLEMGRFARAFGLLIEHGVTVIEAIDIALSVVRNPIMLAAMQSMPASLQQGNSLAKAFEQVGGISPFVINTVAVGEEGGRAGEALLEIANYYENEAERLLGVAAALLEPVMVLAVGALVGWIVMAVMLPIFELGSIV